ncbi:MAG: sugar phosphate nucleotidyltransferase, partial [Candidatus Humimicrobiaceae bacterium]
MKGVILAGGLGSRMLPCTKVTNKHLLPVYNKPMIYYPLNTLVKGGLKDIMIVTGGNNAGDFLRLLGNGSEFGLKDISYTYQEGEGGIADALKLAENFVDEDKVIVMLGDNIIKDDISEAINEFEKQPKGAKIFLKEVSDPERFGVAEIKDGKVINIEEKPEDPKSNYSVIGL